MKARALANLSVIGRNDMRRLFWAMAPLTVGVCLAALTLAIRLPVYSHIRDSFANEGLGSAVAAERILVDCVIAMCLGFVLTWLLRLIIFRRNRCCYAPREAQQE